MTGFKAFKYYMALKLHFTTQKFDVFVRRGNIKGTYEKFMLRNDRLLFEKLASLYNDREYIQYIASNFMYGHPNMIYDVEEGQANYKEFIRRKQSITRVFSDDLDTIIKVGTTLDFSGNKIPDVLQLLMSGKITIETAVILNNLDNFVNNLKDNTHINLMLGDQLLVIEKATKFVKYDETRIKVVYQNFCEEVEGITHG